MRSFIVFIILCFWVNLHAQERKFTLSDEYFFSSVQIVANDQYIGLFDRRQKFFLLLDALSGEVITQIDARDSFPGFNWMPFRAKLLKNEVFFENSAPFGVYISTKNEVTHVADKRFRPTGIFDFLSDSVYVGFYTYPSGEHHIAMVDRDGNQVARPFETTPVRFPNLVYRDDENNFLEVFEGRIYLLPVGEQEVYVYNFSGVLEEKLSLEIPRFINPRRDIRNRGSNMDEFMHELKVATSGSSSVLKMFTMGNQTLIFLTRHSTGEESESNVITRLNVQTLKKETIVVPKERIPTFGRENLLYFVDIEKEPVEIRIVDFQEYWSQIKQN
jgi:hypothetical protein